MTLVDVKINGSYTHVRATFPTSSEKSPDFISGETWLDTTTGLSYQLWDDSTGEWRQIEVTEDARINQNKRAYIEMVLKNLNTRFLVLFGIIGTFTVLDDTLTLDGLPEDGLISDLAAGDFVSIDGLRNSGVFKVIAVDPLTNKITIDEKLRSDAGRNSVIAMNIPIAVQNVVAKMLHYDNFIRASVSSESIGSYSYSPERFTNALAYPDDIVGVLNEYRDAAVDAT